MDRRHFLLLTGGFFAGTGEAVASGHNAFCVMRDTGGGYLPQKQIVIHGERYESFRAEALATGKPQSVLVETAPGYRTALRDIRSGRLPPGSIAMFDRSRFPESLLEEMDRPLKQVSVYFNIPETLEEARNVHGRRPFQRGLSDGRLQAYLPAFKLIADAYRAIGATRIEARDGRSAAEFLRSEVDKRGPDELVILVGHVNIFAVEETAPGGDRAEYPAGQLPLIDSSLYMLEHAKKNGPTVWTIGCDTWPLLGGILDLQRPELAFTVSIGYPDTLPIVRQMRPGSTLRDTINQLQRREWLPAPAAPRPRIPDPDDDDHSLPGNPSPMVLVVELQQDKSVVITNKMVA